MNPLSLDQSWVDTRIPELTILVYRPGHQGPGPAHLVARFTADDRGLPKLFVASGPQTEQPRRGKIWEEVNADPTLSDAAILSRLHDSGAKFASVTPATLLQAVNLERFQSLLGAFRIVDAHFTVRSEAQDIRERMTVLEWRVTTEMLRRGPVRGYVFAFEPFAGQLVVLRQVR